jgi:hypothetical protein
MGHVTGITGAAGTIAASCLIFVGCAYFSRAPWGRVLAAVFSAAPVAGLNITADVLAYHGRWWRYPDVVDRSFGPVAWYVSAAIGVARLTLIGWRAHRRWGLTGIVAFLLALAFYGTLRDWVVSRAAPGIIVFGAGHLPRIADYATWLGCAGVAVAVLTLLRGPPGRDTPRPGTRRRCRARRNLQLIR